MINTDFQNHLSEACVVIHSAISCTVDLDQVERLVTILREINSVIDISLTSEQRADLP